MVKYHHLFLLQHRLESGLKFLIDIRLNTGKRLRLPYYAQEDKFVSRDTFPLHDLHIF